MNFLINTVFIAISCTLGMYAPILHEGYIYYAVPSIYINLFFEILGIYLEKSKTE